MSIERFIGVDLAWRDEAGSAPANETGVAALDRRGIVLEAGWTRGVAATVDWVQEVAGDRSALLFVDAPLVVENVTGQRVCEQQVGQCYGRWKVSANTTNQASPRRAGVTLLARLQECGWTYHDGRGGPPVDGRLVSECYPYTTLVGVEELGYDVQRPRYKRKPRRMPVAQWRGERAAACDDLIGRLGRLAAADPPMILDSHPLTAGLAALPAPIDDAAYKHREDLIDAVLCAWTAALWYRHGQSRCQVLGAAGDPATAAATVIAPTRPGQRITTAVRTGAPR
ncbi:DUF429 domain-containing protein [Plantactinospora sp. WMMB334]|uniref:DUF429 domain-containing protein n=1 Tax=Plantactinospora sp. WMMB334 TaxID=3404119 RepID=UPI003B934BA1